MDFSEVGLAPLLLAFSLGFGASLTPCVYPLIPVTLALFGASKDTPRRRAFLLSLTYVLGIALTYTSLGLVAAYTGSIFGSLLGNPYVVGFFVLLLVALSLYMLDIVSLGFVQKLQQAGSSVGGAGFAGAFIMGTLSGVVAAPCVGPALIAILSVAASSKSPAWGAALLFAYSIGMGVIFVVLGTFSGLIHRIPRAGNWLVYVKFLLAAALLVVAAFLAQPFIPHTPMLDPALDNTAAMLLLLCTAVAAAFFGNQLQSKLLPLLGASLIAVGTYQLVIAPPPTAHQLLSLMAPPDNDSGQHSPKPQGVHWLTDTTQAFSQAKEQGTLVMLDLYADWCAACKELERITFADPQVMQRLASLVTARVDFTLPNDQTEALTERYNVAGLPCVLFLNPDGSEIPETRVSGFLNPQEFMERLDGLPETHAQR